MLEHAKIFWMIRTFPLRDQKHWTHSLCWNMQRLVDWYEHSIWEIRNTGLTGYVGTCENDLTDQNISFEKSELTSYGEACKDYVSDQNIPLKSEALNIQAMMEQIIWLVKTFLLRSQRHWTHSLCWTCKDYLTDQNISFEKLKALYSQPMWKHAKIIWLIRTFLLRNQRHWTHILCWSMQR